MIRESTDNIIRSTLEKTRNPRRPLLISNTNDKSNFLKTHHTKQKNFVFPVLNNKIRIFTYKRGMGFLYSCDRDI